MLTKDEATTRVARGAAHLDTVRPGWFHRIDVGRLSLGDCVDCIIGQLFGAEATAAGHEEHPFAFGLKALGWWHGDACTEYGVGGFGRGEPSVIQDAWIEAIADRVLAAAQAHSAPPSTNAVREETEQPGVPLRV